jgi:tetratricopeptide (TPR) repeat protein/tRNA A-37 threonylcarbamoyl transferase component Bud32
MPDPPSPSRGDDLATLRDPSDQAGSDPAETRAGGPGTDGEKTAEVPALGEDRPPSIPGYDILAQIGRGGMGVVYKARQAGLNRTVALKTVRTAEMADPVALVRFLAEAEVVAAIDHPHVVRVFEFGQRNGAAYLAMEYLPGAPLSARLGSGPMPPRDAAELLEKVARGVAAAHAQGVVHRDLKPGNVLFDEAGRPKVTDFGLAKRAGSDLTRTRVVIGTPAYMAPEQAAGEAKFVGPPADVWALGVTLYEALTGTHPFRHDDTWVTLQRVLLADPDPLRRRAPHLPRDLEQICLKCLAREPHERYPTAAELADDLRRFLDGRSISARPVGPLPKAARWARRNPVLAGLLVALLVATVGLAGAAAVGYREAVARADEEVARTRAERQLREQEVAARVEADRLRDRAVRAKADADAEAERANQVSDFLGRMFQSSDPLNIFGDDLIPPSWEKQRRKTAADFLREAAANFPTELTDQPLPRAKLLATVGNSFRSLGLFQDAEPLLREALNLRRANLPADHPDLAQSELDLGRLFLDLGDFQQAAERFRTALAIQRAAGVPERLIATTRLFEGWALSMWGKPEAEAVIREGVAARERIHGKNHPATLIAKMGLAAHLIDQGRPTECLALAPDILAALEAQPDGQTRKLGRVTVAFQAGVILRAQANGNKLLLAQSERSLREALAEALTALPEDHIYVSLIRHELASTLEDLGRAEEAEALDARVLTDLRNTTGLAHPKTLIVVERYADRLARTGRARQAQVLFDEVDQANRERFGPDNHWRGLLLLSRAEFEARQQQEGAAAKYARDALELARSGKLMPTRVAFAALQDAALALGRRPPEAVADTAAALHRAALRYARKACGDPSPELAAATRDLGDYLFRTGDRVAGARLIEEAAAGADRLTTPLSDRQRGRLLGLRGRSEAARGRFADAERHLREALALARKAAPDRDREEAAATLAGVLADQERAGEAVSLLEDAKRLAYARRDCTDADRARAAGRLAAIRLATGDKAGYRVEVKEMVRRFGDTAQEDVLTAVARAAALAPGHDGWDPSGLSHRLTAVPAESHRPPAARRAPALLLVRSGAPAEAEELLALDDTPATAADHLVLGLAAAQVGDAGAAREHLWTAEVLRSAARPSADRPFAYADASWLSRLEETVLSAELRRSLPAELAPTPPRLTATERATRRQR